MKFSIPSHFSQCAIGTCAVADLENFCSLACECRGATLTPKSSLQSSSTAGNPSLSRGFVSLPASSPSHLAATQTPCLAARPVRRDLNDGACGEICIDRQNLWQSLIIDFCLAIIEFCACRGGWQVLREAKDVTKDEKLKILEGVENYPLPEGVFFNGSKYVNWDGETLKEHPCMPEMIDNFLKQERADVTRSNEEICCMQGVYQQQVASCIAGAAKAVGQPV